jgi:hypothetical protein
MTQNFRQWIWIPFVCLLASCAGSYKSYDANKKFSRAQLEEDYKILQQILETKHPALTWYTPADSMRHYFDSCFNNIADSMTELQFGWQVVAPLTQKIHCGHTTFGMSKNWLQYVRNKRIPSFPLYLKIWGDTMLVTGNLNPKDSIIKRGYRITSINQVPAKKMLRQMFQYMPTDGYAESVNYIRLSGNFPYFHRNIFGLFKNYRVGYIDSAGNEKTTLLPMFVPVQDTSKKAKPKQPVNRPSRAERKKQFRESSRKLSIDSSNQTATILLNTFSSGEGRHLRRFIKQSFKEIKEKEIKNLIIDLRNNGGGNINLYVLLTKYIRQQPFKVADSAYAVTKTLKPYTQYIQQGWLHNLGLRFFSKKKADGNYHFRYYEKHWYQPKTKNHYDGKLYVITSGPTFSASTLFCNAVKGQSNVTIVGEEAGGGWHGNSGIMIPDITLPNTRIRIRLPLFKIVQFQHAPKDGRGVVPDIEVMPTTESILKMEDRKMKVVLQLIQQNH